MTTGELNYGEDNFKKKEQSRQFDCVDEHSKWHDPPQVQTKADGTHRPRPRLERDCRRKGERSQPTDFFFFFFFFLEKPKRSAVSPQDSTTLGFSKPPPPLYLHYLPRLSFVLLFSSLSLSLPSNTRMAGGEQTETSVVFFLYVVTKIPPIPHSTKTNFEMKKKNNQKTKQMASVYFPIFFLVNSEDCTNF